MHIHIRQGGLRLPQSATSQTQVALAVASLATAALVGRIWFADQPRTTLALMIVAVSFTLLLPLWPTDLLRKYPPTAVLEVKRRVALKLLGLSSTYALIGLGYWVFPYYREPQFAPFFSLALQLLPVLLVVTPLYVWLTDRLMEDPHDGCLMAGLATIGAWGDVDRRVLGQYALGWLVKAFFLPLMISYAYEDVLWFLHVDLASALSNSDIGWYILAYRLIFAVELIWVACGYLLTLRLFNTHIRSTDPTVSGWLACIICYAPFWALLSRQFFATGDTYSWGDWLSEPGPIRQAWALLITVSLLTFAWADLSFGPRFSNLTHRGIITNGPYRWSKHPGYIAKNISWWLIAIPFVSHNGVSGAVRETLLLASVSLIYFARAKTEERHLLRDETYQQYAAWIDENGALARVRLALTQFTRLRAWPKA